jgi:Putative zinc- or iron-chelating domain
MDETNETPANTLCKACGLCCTGHLFIWAKLRPAELDPAESLGLTVIRSDPRQRGFNQPCPLWQGECTIYTSKHYPHVCRAYQCRLLKEMSHADISLDAALNQIEQTKAMIHELDELLPDAPSGNFRERLVAYIETDGQKDRELFRKAEDLLHIYEEVFGVNDLVETSDEK